MFAFEPNPTVFRELAEHLDRNALQDRSGLSTLVSDSIVAAGHFGQATAVPVKTVSFDEWQQTATSVSRTADRLQQTLKIQRLDEVSVEARIDPGDTAGRVLRI